VLVHGWMHTGEHYLTTIDGRPGWASDFAAAGFRAVVVDWPGIGSSPPVDPALITSEFNRRGLAAVIESVGGPVDLLVHSMSGPYGFSLLETHGDRIANLVAVSPAPPADLATRPDLVEDLGDVIRHVYSGAEVRTPKRADWVHPERSFVVDKVIGTSPRFPTADADAYVRTLVPMWSGLGHEHIAAVTGPAPDPSEATPLAGRILVVTGTHDRDHSRETDAALAAALGARGASCTHLYLGDRGIEGNSHVPMLDDNSSEVAQVIVEWLRRAG
jgi:pimeloyl-ACP methyl ester carboxylesterase